MKHLRNDMASFRLIAQVHQFMSGVEITVSVPSVTVVGPSYRDTFCCVCVSTVVVWLAMFVTD